jgi:hypothetical protein
MGHAAAFAAVALLIAPAAARAQPAVLDLRTTVSQAAFPYRRLAQGPNRLF